MKRLLYIFAFLFVSFAAMAAHDLAANSKMYFAKPDNWGAKYIQFMIGHDSWSQGYAMSSIPNTKLYYVNMPSWGDYNGWAVLNTNESVWNGTGEKFWDRYTYAVNETNAGWTALGSCNLINMDGGDKGFTALTDYKSLNKTHTIKSYVDDVELSDGGTVSASSYKLSSANATSATNGTTSIEAAYTATITLTATANPGYEFMGWYDGTTELSTDITYSYTAPNEAKTISAKFRKLAVAEPRIVSFSASATEIDLGQSVTFDVEVENAELNDVVFKIGEEVISNPWKPAEGGVYTITANLEGATPKSVVVTVYAATVFFDNTNSEWAEIYAYCWNESATIKNADWPGIQLVDPVDNLYAYKTIQPYDSIIFNHGDGDKKTADLLFEDGKTYSMPKPVPVVAGTANLCGSAWSSSDENNAMEEVDGVFSKTYTDLSAGEYEFKVVYEGEWYGFDKLSDSSTEGTEDKDGNIGFQLIDETNVTISFNISTKNITIIAEGVEKFGYTYFPVGETIYFSTDKEASRYAAYFYGPEEKTTWVNLEQKYKNIYTLEVPEGEWDGLIFCAMKQGTAENNWDNKDEQTEDLRYRGKNWYFWGTKDGVSSYWRNFENLIFAGQKLYFKPDSNWEADGARFAAYYWDVLGENKWADCVYNEENDVYEVIAPIVADTVGEDVFESVWTNIKFLRMNPDFEDNGWNKGDEDETEEPKRVWNKTEDLVFDGINDLFIIKLTRKAENGKDWDWNSADINNWVNYGTCFKDFIFFKPNEAQKNNRFAIWLWNGFGDGCWAKFQILAKYNNIYYVVIPDGFWTGANICSMNPETIEDNWDNKLLQTQNLTYHSDKLLYKVPNVWEERSIENECWSDLEAEIDFDPEKAIEINGGMENGAYYQAKKYTISISGSDVNKWHWISLPYDVNVADIKSNITTENPYGIDFIMKRYDTATRAAWEEEQAPVDDQTWIQLTKDDVLEAGRGYILGVNDSLTGGVTLTFPANSYFHIVSNQVDGKNDNIEAPIQELNVNSNWHLIGTGLYAEAQSSGGVNFVAYPDKSGSDYTYHYLNSDEDLKYHETTLKSTLGMYKAFFVQYGGEYSFSKEAVVRNMAPRRARTEEDVEQYYINIKSEKERSRTAIFLADDGSDAYVVGKDFLHFGVTRKTTQLYTKQNARLLSFNHLKKEDCVVELGGYVINAGEYTISLTDNGASSIVLIDNYTGESVDLTFEDYIFTTEKGSLDGRFTLAISYIEKDVTTEIGNENVGNILVSNYNDLVVVEGLTIGNHVWIYDAVGRCVSSFVAEEERYVLNVKEGAYVLKTSMESVKFVVW